MITFEDRFISGKSKSSAIRNPVLRVLHRGISNAVFPRSDMGSVNNTELHLIYCLLRRKCNDLSKHLPLYWEKIVKPSTADILCGAHVTQILRALNVEEREGDAIPGEKFITLEGLHNMDIVKVDGKLRPYVFQAKAGDHFPLPCPRLTHIDDWDGDRSNWRMDTLLHRLVIAANPVSGDWKKHVTPLISLVPIPEDGASSSHAIEQHMDEAEEGSPEMERNYRYNRHWRRRDHEQREEEDTLTARLGRMQDQSDQRWEEQNQRWNQLEQRLDHWQG